MQIISKDKVIKCVTTVNYPAEIVKIIKKSGYKVKEINKNGEN